MLQEFIGHRISVGNKLAESIERKMASILGGDIQVAWWMRMAKQRALFESKDVLNQKKGGFLPELSRIVGDKKENLIMTKAFQIVYTTGDARRKLSLLLDATGHQIFHDGLYNGDPHPGNVLVLDCSRLGLIDYDQTRTLTQDDRLALAGGVAVLGKQHNKTREISNAMKTPGFHSRYSNDENMAKFAALYLYSDAAGKKLGYPIPQKYLMYLNLVNSMMEVPDPAVFVART